MLAPARQSTSSPPGSHGDLALSNPSVHKLFTFLHPLKHTRFSVPHRHIGRSAFSPPSQNTSRVIARLQPSRVRFGDHTTRKASPSLSLQNGKRNRSQTTIIGARGQHRRSSKPISFDPFPSKAMDVSQPIGKPTNTSLTRCILMNVSLYR